MGSKSTCSTASKVIFIGIAGPSGCGKSTYARHLADNLHSPLNPVQLDHFFKGPLLINHSKLGETKTWELPDCLKIEDFLELLVQLKQKPKIVTEYHRENVLINENEYLFIIIEGYLLYALSDEITNLFDIKIFFNSTLSECRMQRFRRRSKIPDDILNEDVIITNEFQQWFDYLVWDEYLKRCDLQMKKAEKIFHSNEYAQRQYTKLDTYIKQRLNEIIQDKKDK